MKPIKLTKQQIKDLEKAFAYDATFAEACVFAKVDISDFNLWLVDHQGHRHKFEQLGHIATLKARREVVDSFPDKPDIALKYLERKKKDEFSLRQEVTGADGKDLFETKDKKSITDKLKDIL